MKPWAFRIVHAAISGAMAYTLAKFFIGESNLIYYLLLVIAIVHTVLLQAGYDPKK